MSKPTKIKNVRLDYHRNGICGIGFHVCLFDWKDDETGKVRHMIGTVFPESGACSIFDVDELQKGNIQFACGNSWRGDNFEPELRKYIADAETGQAGPFAIPMKPHDLTVAEHGGKHE